MNITFNKNSWHYKYFNWVTGMEPPKSLCPYFWINVAITILLPILLLVKLIIYIGIKITSKKEKKPNFEKIEYKYDKKYLKTESEIKFQKKKDKFFMKLGDIVFFIVSFILFPAAVLSTIYSLGLVIYSIPFDILWTAIFILFSIIIAGIILFHFLLEISGIFKYLNPFNWIITIIFWEMVKSVYKKACPLIKWED